MFDVSEKSFYASKLLFETSESLFDASKRKFYASKKVFDVMEFAEKPIKPLF